MDLSGKAELPTMHRSQHLIYRLLIAVLLMLTTAIAAAQITAKEFTADFVASLRAANADIDIQEVEALQVKVTTSTGTEHKVYLDNAYSLYLQDNEALQETVDLYVTSLLETIAAEEAPVSASNIVPIIKDDGWLDELARATGGELPDYFRRPLVDGLFVIYAEDRPTNIRYVEKSALEDAGIDTDAIATLSVENLLEKLPDIEVHGENGLYMVTAGGNFEASLLLVDSIWDGANFDVKGDILVSIPARDILLVSGSGETQQLARLMEMTESAYAESPYYISEALYVRTAGGWKLYRPGASDE